ncbi:hypothetical protein GW915_06765 [bacterium]|nr:hypothetical protein [bacterium]
MAKVTRKPKENKRSQQNYDKLCSINGSHELWDKVDDIGVPYRARKRKGAEVAYFNFALAKEMGVIPQNHPEILTNDLEKAIIDTFSITIINENDIQNGRRFKKSDVKENFYYATRYLQLQHESRQGKTSGDGRSIWNGQFKGKDATWDITSCGTGATCLSPATAKSGKFFKSGDPGVSYGCGTADLSDGIAAILMSEVFNHYGYPTERTLAVLRYPGKQSINVRAGKNLIRPAHMFRYLKMGKVKELRALVNLFIERQLHNRSWRRNTGEHLYDTFLTNICDAFAHSTALFESFYIFCWLDWDGDNILAADAGILDYGSVRQFGLFHKEYRYDDDDRWSTTIGEQKLKARHIIQNFAQLTDFIKTGTKKPIEQFKDHPSVLDFAKRFEHYKKYFLLKRIGFNSKQAETLVPKLQLDTYQKTFEYFERLQSKKGVYKVEDGVTSNAVFCMKDFLREFPQHYMRTDKYYTAKGFTETCGSNYAIPEDFDLSSTQIQKLNDLQKEYVSLLKRASKLLGTTFKKLILEVTMRSSVVNRYDRITGNGVMCVTDRIMSDKKCHHNRRLFTAIKDFVEYHTGKTKTRQETKNPGLIKVLESILEENREEI